MALECELKFTGADLTRARADLARLGARCGGRVFERNLVFDTPDRSLRAGDVLLRLRRAGKTTLTLKRHPAAGCEESRVKVWEEFESAVEDFDAVRSLLTALGYTVILRYEKFRETWMLPDVEVCLDELPFGDFVEIEGPEAAIWAAAQDLRLDVAAASKMSYHALNAAFRQGRGLAPEESFVFAADDPRRPRGRIP